MSTHTSLPGWTPAFTQAISTTVTDGATSSTTDLLTLTHNSSATPAAGFGTGILFVGQDASNGADNMARIYTAWGVATASSETSKVVTQTMAAGATLADTWTVDPRGSSLVITDAATTSPTNVLTIDHYSTNAGGAGAFIGGGCRLLFRTEDDAAAGSAIQETGSISALWTNSTAATLASKMVLRTRTGGAALADALTINADKTITVAGQGSAAAPALVIGATMGVFNDGSSRLSFTADGSNTMKLAAKQLRTTAGSTTLPNYSEVNDTNSGLLIPGSDILSLVTGGAQRVYCDALGNVQLAGDIDGAAALATTATDKFPYTPTCAGMPTGVPTAKTGFVPRVYDTTNSAECVYSGGWRASTTKRTVTVGHADLTDADTEQTISIGTSLPANARIISVSMQSLTPFSGGTVIALVVDIGAAGDTDALVDGADLFTAAVDGCPATMTPGIQPNKFYSAATQLQATFTSTGDNLVNLTAGSVVIDVLYVVIP